jgi:hypothetical protein
MLRRNTVHNLRLRLNISIYRRPILQKKCYVMALLTTSHQPFVDPTWRSRNIRNDVKISTLTQIIPHHDKFKHSTHFNKGCSNINLKYNSLLCLLPPYRMSLVHSEHLTSSLTTTRLSAEQHLTGHDSFLFQQTTPCSKRNFLIRSNT